MSLIFAKKKEDIKAIKSMCGCYEVNFNFSEVSNYSKDPKNYIPSDKKNEVALEWIELIEETPQKISLQHLLISNSESINDKSIIKHWRQDWLYQNTRFYNFDGFNRWKYSTKTLKEVENEWTQSVYEIDDRPRYVGSSVWVHSKEKKFWKSTSNAPLPRREYIKRNDYNIMKRTNTHEIVKNGWIHIQNNNKMIKDREGNEYILAQEKGCNFYKRVEEDKCNLAKKWWDKNKNFWEKVRAKWDFEFSKNKDLKIKDYVGGKPLYVHLNTLKIDASKNEINSVIDQFILP